MKQVLIAAPVLGLLLQALASPLAAPANVDTKKKLPIVHDDLGFQFVDATSIAIANAAAANNKRSHGADDAPGDDHGGDNPGGDDAPGDDHGGDNPGGDDAPGDDRGGDNTTTTTTTSSNSQSGKPGRMVIRSHGADDAPGDDHGGDNPGGDDAPGDDHGGDNPGGDDAPGDDRGGDNTTTTTTTTSNSQSGKPGRMVIRSHGADDAPGDDHGGDNPGGDDAPGDDHGGDNPGGDDAPGDDRGGDNTTTTTTSANSNSGRPGRMVIRSHGADDAPGDDHGGNNPGGDDAPGDDHGGDNPGGDDAPGDDRGGDNTTTTTTTASSNSGRPGRMVIRSHGADDAPGDDHGGDNPGGDDAPGDDHGGDNPGGDDAPGDDRGGDNTTTTTTTTTKAKKSFLVRSHGADDAPGDDHGGDNPGGDDAPGDDHGGDNPGGDDAPGDDRGGDNTTTTTTKRDGSRLAATLMDRSELDSRGGDWAGINLIPRQTTIEGRDFFSEGFFDNNLTVAERLSILSHGGTCETLDCPPDDPTSGDGVWISPVYTNMFSVPLFFNEDLQPIMNFTNDTTGETVRYYEIRIQNFTKQVYPDLEATRMEGYNAKVPGPIINADLNIRSMVRFINEVGQAASIHLHGSPTRPPWDGWAADETLPGQFKDYFYPNVAPRSLWYHDHALGLTARNVYFGQQGVYVVRDPSEVEEFGLPPQGPFDVYLQLSDRKFQANGQLIDPTGETEMFYGDVIFVNGDPWPFLEVEPRLYRFRFLAAAINRTFKLQFQTANGTVIPFHIIGTDSGLNDAPVPVEFFIIAIAERYEAVFDFTGFEGQEIFLRNARQFSVNPDFAFTDFVMKFNVTNNVTDQAGNGPLPETLLDIPFPADTGKVDRSFRFERQNGGWKINGVGWDDPDGPPIIADPPTDGVEVWELVNSAGGWAHPVHIHLIDFRIISRTGRGVEPFEASGFKDVAFTAEGETVHVIARFAPWTGQYMFHCHNLVHEDNDMMGTFDVNNTVANEAVNGDRFSNPRSPEFSAQDMTEVSATDNAIMDRLSFFTSLNAYVTREDFCCFKK